MANRAELQTKVDGRRKQLKAAFAATQGDKQQFDRRKSLEASIRLVDDALQGGWDKVSEASAAELTKWLDSTQPMILPANA